MKMATKMQVSDDVVDDEVNNWLDFASRAERERVEDEKLVEFGKLEINLQALEKEHTDIMHKFDSTLVSSLLAAEGEEAAHLKEYLAVQHEEGSEGSLVDQHEWEEELHKMKHIAV